jgi:hypothetical protein
MTALKTLKDSTMVLSEKRREPAASEAPFTARALGGQTEMGAASESPLA